MCIYVCICVCVFICMYVCMHVCMYACIHACMHVCMYARMYACTAVSMHGCECRRWGQRPMRGRAGSSIRIRYLVCYSN